jgi:hypothetical protein
MTPLIHIPDQNAYATALAILSGVGCLSLAAHVHARWLAKHGIEFMPTYLGILAVVTTWGVAVFGPRSIVPSSWRLALLSFPVGALAGWSARRADGAINRHVADWQRRRKEQFRRGSSAATARQHRELTLRVHHLPFRQASRSTQRRATGVEETQWNARRVAEEHLPSLNVLLAVAALEEVSFRGYLLQACLRLPTVTLAAAAVFSIGVLFALSHVFFGWREVLAKAPLSAVATVSALALGSVLPAVIAHAVFNASVWRDSKLQPLFVPKSPPLRRLGIR